MAIVKTVIVGLIASAILIPCIAAMPVITISAEAVISGAFFSYIRAGLYFLPLGTVSAILMIQVALWIFRIVIAVVKVIWELLPFA